MVVGITAKDVSTTKGQIEARSQVVTARRATSSRRI